MDNQPNIIMDKISVKKRNNQLEEFDITKINKMTEWAVKDIKDVSSSYIEINANLSFKDGITTTEIQNCLIDSAVNLITEDTPNYQIVAAKLLNVKIRKDVWGGKNPPKLLDLIKKNIKKNIYTTDFLEKYTEEEINKIDEFIDHDRDYIFQYSGLKQLVDKYLQKNRITGELYESPQFAYALIATKLFQNYKPEIRLKWIKKTYDAYSKHKINLPTPLMANCRSRLNSFASCALLDVLDNKESLYANMTGVGMLTCASYGIGINGSRIRAIGSSIRKGAIPHLGVIPWIKCFESIVKAASQGTRGGGATVTFHFFHKEIEDIIQLKNNTGTDDNRVRHLDYTIALSKLFYERYLKDQNITLFCPNETQELYKAFGHPEFDDLYKQYEKRTDISKKVISAKDLMSLLIKETIETGRIYILNIDHVNSHSSWDLDIKMSNLCLEVMHPLEPMKSYDDPDSTIGVCVLAAVNMLQVDEDHLEGICEIIVRMLDEMIDIQDYINNATRNFATKHRSLGVGVSNYAAYLAKHKTLFTDEKALELTHNYFEKLQYFLLKASNNLAKEKGVSEWFYTTKYSKGILPIDTYKKEVDTIFPNNLQMDWETLRDNIMRYGLRNNSLSCQMPCDSSSVIQSSTNGVEPPMQPLVYKSSKSGRVPVLVPHIDKWKNYYSYAFTFDNIYLIKLYALIQKFFDMGISMNNYYDFSQYPDNKLPDSVVLQDLLNAYKYGHKSRYYAKTRGVVDDASKQDQEQYTSCSINGGCTL